MRRTSQAKQRRQAAPRAKRKRMRSRSSGVLPRVLPALGISASLVLWGLSIEYFYAAAAGGIGLAAILALASRASRPTVVGIDVGHSAIKVVELSRGANPTLLRYAITPTPTGAVADGLVRNRDLLVEGLTAAIEESGIKQSEVVTVMTGQTLVLQHLDFPRMRDGELRSAVAEQITAHVPMPEDEILFDYHRVPTDRDDLSRVLLVATQRDPVVSLVETMHEAGLTPTRVDIEPLAGYRAVFREALPTTRTAKRAKIAARPETPANGKPVVRVLVDLGAGTSNVSVYQDGMLQLQRVLRVAGDDFNKAISIGLHVDVPEAEALKREHGLIEDSPISFAIRPVAESLFREIRLALEFSHSRNRDVAFAEMAIIGGNARLKGLAEQLQEHLRSSLEGIVDVSGLQVQLPTSEGRIEGSRRDSPQEDVFPILAVALGLALGEVAAGGSR